MLRATHSFHNKFFGFRVSRNAASKVGTGRLGRHGFNGFNANERAEFENFPDVLGRGIHGDKVLVHDVLSNLLCGFTSRIPLTQKFWRVASQVCEDEQYCTDVDVGLRHTCLMMKCQSQLRDAMSGTGNRLA